MSGAAAGDVMEKTGPEGVTVGSRRLYWNRTGGWTGGREGASVVDSVAGGVDGVGDTGVGDTGVGDTVEVGGDRGGTETGSSDGGSGNRKDKETEGAGEVVEEDEA